VRSFVLTCLRDDEASGAVWNEAAGALPEDAIAVELSTVSPGHCEALSRRPDFRFVAAPMVGSTPQLDAGELVLLCAGEEATVDEVRPVLSAFAGRLLTLASPTEAATMKLAINGLFAAQLAVTGELLAMLRHSGMDEREATEMIGGLPVTAPATARSLPRVLARDTTAYFPVELVAKDLGYLLAQAGPGAGVIAAVAGLADTRVEQGRGGEDVASLAMP
jgi:3-hydroxyisobutyrate dehydrogenase-like beta-hydroxyacid dehydrogenase